MRKSTGADLSSGIRYYFFNIIFSFTYTPLQGVIPAEALETTMRAKGLALSGVLVSGKSTACSVSKWYRTKC
jgi:hypothetical protein